MKHFDSEYEKFLELWGIKSQMIKAVEEMSELTKEICKSFRVGAKEKMPKSVEEHIKEELADVMNMSDQLAYYFGREEIEKIRQEKIDRTMGRIEKDGEKFKNY